MRRTLLCARARRGRAGDVDRLRRCRADRRSSWTYAARAGGSYGVGLTTFTAADPARPGRTLTFDAWYPTAPGTATGSPASLDLLVTQLALPGVRRDATPIGRRSPLVVFSHGSGGVRYQSWFLLQALASHGYVVVAPDHAGNTTLDTLFGTVDPFPVVAANRPRDVSFAIDVALGRSATAGDLLAGTIDPSRVAVGGHSFGGFTALAVAGGYQTYAPDERVDAIMPIAAASGLLTDDELAAIDVPTLLLSGTDDVTVPLTPPPSGPGPRSRPGPPGGSTCSAPGTTRSPTCATCWRPSRTRASRPRSSPSSCRPPRRGARPSSSPSTRRTA